MPSPRAKAEAKPKAEPKPKAPRKPTQGQVVLEAAVKVLKRAKDQTLNRAELEERLAKAGHPVVKPGKSPKTGNPYTWRTSDTVHEAAKAGTEVNGYKITKVGRGLYSIKELPAKK
jgi:hypothetical protein